MLQKTAEIILKVTQSHQ